MKLSIGVPLALIFAVVTQADAADGRPTQSKLSKLGLKSMKVVSDEQGHIVRGKFLAVGGILTPGASTASTPLGGTAVFPAVIPPNTSVNPLFYIAGNAPRPLGNTVFGVTGFGTVNVTTSATGNPSFSGFVNVPYAVTATDISGSATVSIQFWSFSAGN